MEGLITFIKVCGSQFSRNLLFSTEIFPKAWNLAFGGGDGVFLRKPYSLQS